MMFRSKWPVKALFLVLSLLGTARYGWGDVPADEVRSAAESLQAWLATSGEGRQWREYLMTEALESELAKGGQANWLLVSEILGRYTVYTKTHPLPPIIQAQNAISRWLEQLPPPSANQILAAIRTQPPPFTPPTDTDLESARTQLQRALEQLDARLKQDGPEGENWRKYLHLEELEQQVSRPGKPDLKTLDTIYRRFDAGYEGLGLIWFRDVREALRRYIATAQAMNLPQLKSQYEKVIKALAGQLETYRRSPTPDNGQAVRVSLRWLADAGQAQPVIVAVERAWGQPNFYGLVSDRLVAALFARTVDEVGPVRDCILGTDIRGTGHTLGNVTARVEPAKDRAIVSLMVNGTTYTNTIGYNGPVQIYSAGTTWTTTRKPLFLDAQGIAAGPATSQASTSSNINNICASRGGVLGGFIERIAWQRALSQQGEANAIAARHAEPRANERTDNQANDQISQANRDFQKRFRRPLTDRGVFPDLLRFQTDNAWLYVKAREAGPLDLAAGGPPPGWLDRPDVAILVHETSLNNLAENSLGGMQVSEPQMRDEIVRLFGKLPERLKAPTKEDEEEPLAITFARQLPIMFAFGDNEVTISVRGQSYTRGDRTYPGMNVTAHYRIEGTGAEWKLVRQGDVEIFPPGYDPKGSRRFSVPEQVLRTLLERRFKRVFDQEIVPQPLEIQRQEGGEPIRLRLVQWDAANGWLRMAWEQETPTAKPVVQGDRNASVSPSATVAEK